MDLVFECSGDPACVEQGQSLLRPGGALMLVGIPPVDAVAFDPHRMRRFELRFQAVRRQNDCVAPVVRLIAERRLDPAPLLTHRFPLSEISAAFELVAGYRDGVIKAVLDVSGGTESPLSRYAGEGPGVRALQIFWRIVGKGIEKSSSGEIS